MRGYIFHEHYKWSLSLTFLKRKTQAFNKYLPNQSETTLHEKEHNQKNTTTRFQKTNKVHTVHLNRKKIQTNKQNQYKSLEQKKISTRLRVVLILGAVFLLRALSSTPLLSWVGFHCPPLMGVGKGEDSQQRQGKEGKKKKAAWKKRVWGKENGCSDMGGPNKQTKR